MELSANWRVSLHDPEGELREQTAYRKVGDSHVRLTFANIRCQFDGSLWSPSEQP